jgi:hypothetical protein
LIKDYPKFHRFMTGGKQYGRSEKEEFARIMPERAGG